MKILLYNITIKMKRGFITMNEPLPVEIKIFTDEMEKHMLKYFDSYLKINSKKLKKVKKLTEIALLN